MTAVLIVLVVVGWAAAVALGLVALRFGRMVLTVEERMELSLDVLDEQYRRLGAVLSVPLATDDAYARAVIDAIKTAQDAVLAVANVLVGQGPRAGKGSGEGGE